MVRRRAGKRPLCEVEVTDAEITACIVAAVGPAIYLVLTGHTSPIQIFVVTSVAVCALILFCAWDASRDRS